MRVLFGETWKGKNVVVIYLHTYWLEFFFAILQKLLSTSWLKRIRILTNLSCFSHELEKLNRCLCVVLQSLHDKYDWIRWNPFQTSNVQIKLKRTKKNESHKWKRQRILYMFCYFLLLVSPSVSFYTLFRQHFSLFSSAHFIQAWVLFCVCFWMCFRAHLVDFPNSVFIQRW